MYKKNLKQYWKVPITWKREKIREIKSLFTISSQRFYNFTPEFSPSYLFLLLSLLHMLAKCLNFDSISSGKISILGAWISWNIFFPEILWRNHFSFSRCDALSFFTTRGTKVLIVASKCNLLFSIKGEERARGRCVKLEKRDIIRKICYKTAIHGKNITVQEKKEKKKKMWRCRENPIGITTDARIIKLASRRCRLEISPREPIIPSDWRSSSTAFSRSSFSPPLFLILACLRTSLARTLKM